ncbi:MAG: type II toxin-antitoxin system VapC family toxin [Steroidobacteraceae bacterium]
MIGLDTNVLVRYVMQDDPKQSAKASRLIESLTPDAPGFIPLVALIEFVRVVTSCYELKRDQVAQAVDALLRSKELVLEHSAQVAQALRAFRAGTAEFADCVIERCAAGADCEYTMTFDQAAAKSAGMTLIS